MQGVGRLQYGQHQITQWPTVVDEVVVSDGIYTTPRLVLTGVTIHSNTEHQAAASCRDHNSKTMQERREV